MISLYSNRPKKLASQKAIQKGYIDENDIGTTKDK